MNRALLLTSASALDAFAGDPEWFPHPVRIIGFAIAKGEAMVRREGRSPASDLLVGAMLTGVVVGGTYVVARLILHGATKGAPFFAVAAEVALAWTCLAARNLDDEAGAVIDALEANDILQARRRLARIVGRDTDRLEASEISRAVIETVAESASDAVMAPLIYMALGGVPLAMAYKAVNTLDSMIGHSDEQYFYFGKFAARLDDVANLIPARLTALGITVCASLFTECDSVSALKTWARDGAKHKSPNAGQPESAMAGALRVRLGGRNTYAGQVIETPRLGAEFGDAQVQHARTSTRLLVAVALLGLTTAAVLASLVSRQRTR